MLISDNVFGSVNSGVSWKLPTSGKSSHHVLCLRQCFNVVIICTCPLVQDKQTSCRGHSQTQELHKQDPPGIGTEVLHLTQAAADHLTNCLLEVGPRMQALV